MGDRGIDIEGLPGDTYLLLAALVFQSAHVVETVDQLDQDNADILRHRDEDLAVIGRLVFRLVLDLQVTDLGDRVDQTMDLLAEDRDEFLIADITVFDDIMQKAPADSFGVRF